MGEVRQGVEARDYGRIQDSITKRINWLAKHGQIEWPEVVDSAAIEAN